MRVYVLYHPNSENARIVEEFAADYKRTKGKSITLVSLETREGAAMASLYDIVHYPAILAVTEDHQLLKYWEGTPFPLMDEVSAYND